jgi:hypothetical protein
MNKMFILLGLFIVVGSSALAQDCSSCPTLICGSSCTYTDPTTGLPTNATCGGDLFNACIDGPPSLPCSSCAQCPAPNTQCLTGSGSVSTCPAGPGSVCNPNGSAPAGTGLFPLLQWKATDPAVKHLIGSPAGNNLWIMSTPGPQNWLSYGPYVTIPIAGDYVAAWFLTETHNPPAPFVGIGQVNVNDATTQNQIAAYTLVPTDPFTVTLPFTVSPSMAGHQFEFRVFWEDTYATVEGPLGYVPLQWNGANPQINPWHLVGRPIGTEWSAQVGDGQQWFQYGPYILFPSARI